MYTQTKTQIIEIISKNGPTQVKDLVQILGITQASVHRALNKLMLAEVLQRKGTPPKVFYFIPKGRTSLPSLQLTDSEIAQVKNRRWCCLPPAPGRDPGAPPRRSRWPKR